MQATDSTLVPNMPKTWKIILGSIFGALLFIGIVKVGLTVQRHTRGDMEPQGNLKFQVKLTQLNPQTSVLNFKIESANGLAAMDIGGTSDPYVIIKVGSHEQRTQTQLKTLTPTWNQSFEFLVYSLSDEVVLDMYDWDKLSEDDWMGQVRMGTIAKLVNEYPEVSTEGVTLTQPLTGQDSAAPESDEHAELENSQLLAQSKLAATAKA
jgi:hypothetical protein